MFGKEQPDVVTEEEVGEYIEQLKRDGLVDLDLEEVEEIRAISNKTRNQRKCDTFAVRYGNGKPLVEHLEGDLDELARLSEDSTSGTQGKK